MKAAWDGLPENPERDGAHVLNGEYNGDTVWLWDALNQAWRYRSGPLEVGFVAACGWHYIGACHTPSEVAALVEQARREERDACAAICEDRAIRRISNGRARVSKADQDIAKALRQCEAAIRARSAS